jgi:hypothetical protein
LNLFDLSTEALVAMAGEVRSDYELWRCLTALAVSTGVEAKALAVESLFELLVLRRGVGL